MIQNKIRLSVTFVFLMFNLFGQEPDLVENDSLSMSEKLDSITQSLLSKDSDSLNGYLNDDLFGIIDTSVQNQYPFIQFDKNNYQFYTKESPTFEKLFFELQQMVKTKKGKLNFYHIGGSHIQADIYTNDMREYLLNYWDDLPGERAFVFPFKMARTNNPWNYAFTSNNEWKGYRSVIHRPDSVHYGLLGAAIACTDSKIDLSFRYKGDNENSPIDHIRVYHNKGEMPYEIKYNSVKNPIIRQFTNELLGFTDTYFKKEFTTFDVEFIKIADSLLSDSVRNEALYIYGFQLMNNHPGISYTAIGINGAGLYTYLENENFTEQLSQAPPDFFAFSVGTNDANVPYDDFDPQVYKKNLEAMMKKVLLANPDCAILLTVPNDSYYKRRYLNKNIDRERTVIIELAKKYEIPVWDLYGIMGELGSSKTWSTNKLMKSDLVHFSVGGYHLKGDLFFEAFLKWIEQMENKPPVTILNKN
ncbi:GDSL-type esterase/lipase family protein [Brumimicrobium mesophilum]|uniref:GDSL-type esterase/lipase family protein n=1 Tax=Brumimicrobium mesophilum TaxID=392717 RepID=UPI000D14480D|nr:GDSL-type esterase/lipase family protein [Brumimicrobium mesophilum]